MSSRIDAPTELRDGVDPIAAFGEAAVRSRATLRHAVADDVASAVVAALAAKNARTVGLAADLAPYLVPIREACLSAGIDADDYATIAADRSRLARLDATVTGCASAVAATGSLVMTATAGRGAGLVAPLHVCVVHAEQVVAGLSDLLRALPSLDTGSLAALQTGPSRTADIEKTLVFGAHGPRAVEVVLVRWSDSPPPPLPG